MSRKKAAILNITATLAGIPLAALAVGAGATSIPWLAALLTLPSAIVAASGTIGSQLAELKPQEQKEENLELPVPSWWDSDDASWQGLCVEIGQYLPALLPEMVQRMGIVQGEDILTEEIARQIFTTLLVETLTTKRFTWAPAPQDRKRVAEEVATPILQKLETVLLPIIERLQRERFLEDTHKTWHSNEQIASHTEKMANILEEQYRASQPRMLSLEEIAILRQKCKSRLSSRQDCGLKHGIKL